MSEPCGHLQARALLGAYALGAVDQDEGEAVEAHLEDCAACRQELAELRAAAERLPARPQPPDDLWERIVAEVQAIEYEQGQRRAGGEAG